MSTGAGGRGGNMRSERFLFLLRGFVVAAASATLLIVSPQAASAQQIAACGPSPEVKAALDQLPDYARPDQGEVAFRAEKGAQLDAKEYIRESAAKLHGILGIRNDPEAIGEYPTLWSLEFKVHPPNEYDALRKQVGEDLNRIRPLNLLERRQWYEALEEGYKLANDQKQSDWAKNERQRLFPVAWEVPGLEQWRKDHPEPKPGDSADKKTEFYSEKLRQNHEWMKVRPNAMSLYWGQLDALGHLDDVPAAEVETDVEAALKAAEANAEPSGVDSDFLFMVAGLLSNKKLEPKRQLELAKK